MKLLLFLLLNLSTFAFKINSLDFNKNIKIGDYGEKEYKIINTTTTPIKYTLDIENSLNNINITPKTFIIPEGKTKNFKIIVNGIKKGNYTYFLTILEETLNLNLNTNNAKIKMKYRIEHKYSVD